MRMGTHQASTNWSIALAAIACITLEMAVQKAAAQSQSDVTAGVEVVNKFNDNIFPTRNNRIADWITVVNPFVELSVENENLRFNLGGSAEIGRYADNTTENYEDYRVYINGRAELAPNTFLFAGIGHALEHEERSSLDDVNGVNPTLYQHTSAYAATLARSGDNTFKVGGTFDRFDFDDNAAINNDDRDRHLVSAGVRWDHRINGMTRVFAEGEWDQRDYDSALDDNGFARDSHGYRIAGGIVHRWRRNLSTEIYAGWIYQDYDDARFQSLSEIDFGGSLRWTPSAEER